MLIRAGLGLVSLVVSALMLKSAMQRLIRGAASMFVAAAAFAIGSSLIGSTVWAAIRRRREHRRATH